MTSSRQFNTHMMSVYDEIETNNKKKTYVIFYDVNIAVYELC